MRDAKFQLCIICSFQGAGDSAHTHMDLVVQPIATLKSWGGRRPCALCLALLWVGKAWQAACTDRMCMTRRKVSRDTPQFSLFCDWTTQLATVACR